MEVGDKSGKRKKLETHRIGPGIRRETLKEMQKEKHSLYDLEYGEKTDQKENEKLTW
jgi:hypothetical protein